MGDGEQRTDDTALEQSPSGLNSVLIKDTLLHFLAPSPQIAIQIAITDGLGLCKQLCFALL